MSSSFEPKRQNESLESKIVVALERITEAFRVLLWNEGKESSLSPIQIQLLIFIKFHQPFQCKVGYLAKEFNLTKATVSESLKTMFRKELIEKQPDPNDSRSYSIKLSSKGSILASHSSLFAENLHFPLSNLSSNQKNVMYDGLIKLIHDLHTSGIISLQRMCYSCNYHQTTKDGSYCKLLKKNLANNEIRIDCPEHESI